MQTFDIPLRFHDRKIKTVFASVKLNLCDKRLCRQIGCPDMFTSGILQSERKRYHRASRRHSRKIIDFALLEEAAELAREDREYQKFCEEEEEYYHRLADEIDAAQSAQAKRDNKWLDGECENDLEDECRACGRFHCTCNLEDILAREPGESTARYALRLDCELGAQRARERG